MNYNNPICFNVPPAITGYALTTHLIKQIIPMPVFARDAVFNEILYRYGLQEVIFKRIPERLLQKHAPSSARHVNSLIARITRIAISALIFTFAQLGPDTPDSNENCSLIKLINIFAVGFFLGLVQEYSGSPYLSIASNMAFLL